VDVRRRKVWTAGAVGASPWSTAGEADVGGVESVGGCQSVTVDIITNVPVDVGGRSSRRRKSCAAGTVVASPWLSALKSVVC